MIQRIFLLLFVVALVLQGCSNKGAAGIFAKKTPYDKYADKLIETGLNKSAIGKLWFSAANKSMLAPAIIKLPYQETGYFGAEKPIAKTFSFNAKRGEKINIQLIKKPVQNFMIYLDIWEQTSANQIGKLVYALDTIEQTFSFEATANPNYLLRLQPELLGAGAYTLTITTSASLSFPVQGKTKAQSFWGDGRDADTRKHEGVDIIANRGTPAIAAAAGTVTRVGTNNLGGNIVFMRPDGKDFNLYYAHLDKQTVTEGQSVSVGDTLGLVGNTGNAITTVPHLHFGIYTFNGAIDPYPFINTTIAKLPAIKGKESFLGKDVRLTAEATYYKDAEKTMRKSVLTKNTLLNIQAVTGDVYKITLPDDSDGYVDYRYVGETSTLNTIKLRFDKPIFDLPDTLAAQKLLAKAGTSVKILASFNDYNFVSANDITGWMLK